MANVAGVFEIMSDIVETLQMEDGPEALLYIAGTAESVIEDDFDSDTTEEVKELSWPLMDLLRELALIMLKEKS